MKRTTITFCLVISCFSNYSQNTLSAISNNSPYSDVKSFGAVGDGKIDDSKAIQNCINSIPAKGGCIIINPGLYLVNKLRLPKYVVGQIVIIGYGATLKSKTNDTILIRKPDNQKEALNKLTNSAIFIEGLKFQGNGGNAQVGLYIGGSYGSSFRDCGFSNLKNGFDLKFGLMSMVENCTFFNIDSLGLNINAGDWKGATGFNSQSNGTYVNNCRFYAKKNQFANIYTKNCSDLRLEGLIFEGYNPKIGLYIGSNVTVFKGLILNGLHNECAESVAMIKMDIPAYSGGVFKYSYVYNQMSTVLIDASKSAGCLIVVDMMLYVPEACKFLKGSAKWAFYNNTWDPNQTKYLG